MKNIQIIDGAENSEYAIFAASDRDFGLIFGKGEDIAFAEDVGRRLGPTWDVIANRLWRRRVPKPMANGIHGTLFYELKKRKKRFYPNLRESDLG